MILQKAVAAFLRRPRDDFRACLTWQEPEIEQALDKLPIHPPLWEPLRRSQRICLLIGAHLRRFAFYNDMGTGKSLIGMALAAYFHEAHGARRFIVLVPNRVNIRGWLEQVEKHAPWIGAVAMPSSLHDKIAMLENSPALLFIETYAGWTRLCTMPRPPSRKKKRQKKDDRVPYIKMVDALAERIDGIIADESSMLGNADSLQTRVLELLVRRRKDFCLFLLSGTPFGREPLLLWSQMLLLDDGYSLGAALGLFRSTFYTATENPFGGHNYKFRANATAPLERCIAHRSIRFPLDAADLPAVQPVIVKLDLAAEPAAYYAAALEQMRASWGNYDLCKNAFVRMRQISSGFLNVRDPDSGAREQVEFVDNPKLDWIRSQLGSMDGQVLIFHDFIHSGQMLTRALDAMGVSNCIINGRVSGTVLNEAYDDFTKGRKQVLLLNSAAGAFGSNLQMARYGIYFESPVPVIIRKQTELRYIRPGSQHHTVVRIDLVMNNTVDADILKFHEEGANLFSAILDGSYRP
jgi:hypothetical protein